MNDREKLARLFDAALQQDDAPAGQSGAAVVRNVPAAFHPPQSSQEQQEYAARQHAYEQQQAHERHLAEQQRAWVLQQAYEQQQAQARQAWEQQQHALAMQQAYEQQKAAYLQQQEILRRQAEAEQDRMMEAARSSQQAVPDADDSWDLKSAAHVQPVPAFGQPAARPAEAPVSTGFVFGRPGEEASGPAERQTDPAMSESEEFAAIMDAKMARTRRKHSRGFLFTMIFFFGPVIGAGGWFVSDFDRVDALRAVASEIRSAGDIATIIQKYQKSLDKIAVRSTQIDDATKMMGIDPTTVSPDEDPYFNGEMKEMAGSDGGPTVAERNKRLHDKFGDIKQGKGMMGKKAGAPASPAPATAAPIK